ncbi:MAG: biotin--[acetyl-CoA-carboxylase] ligase [Planctomycetota bacterium]
MNGATPVHLWLDRLEARLVGLADPVVSRALVVAETGSTQDAARRMAGRSPGLVVVADRQTAGRGRRGRAWIDAPDSSLAMTLALDAHAHPGASVALAAGVGVCQACAGFVPRGSLGVKWPNDIVDRETDRKVAGVLIETAGPLLLVGIGINASHAPGALAEAGLPEAVSLAELAGEPIDRIELACAVLGELMAVLAGPESAAIERWRTLETLTGTHQAFEHDGRVVSGLVESIEPTLTLVVRTETGLVRLPAMSTSVINGNDAQHAV